MNRRAAAFVIFTTGWLGSAWATQEAPFDTSNQSPLIQIYGLPGISAAQILAPGATRVGVHFEAANHFLAQAGGSEYLYLDGETHRTTLKLYRGLSAGREVGVELPYVGHDGGFLDSFIEGWHDFFGFPQHGRDEMPRNQLLLRYERNGSTRVDLTQPVAGLGDARLVAGQALDSSTALRLSIKLPSGDSTRLLGSGGADVALWVSTACRQTACSGSVYGYGGAGLLWTDKGDVLPDLQRRWIAFGSAGLHWRALSKLTLGAQIDGHTPFYDDTALTPIAQGSIQLALGGIWRLHRAHAVELAVIEDVAIDTAPDVVIRLGVRSMF